MILVPAFSPVVWTTIDNSFSFELQLHLLSFWSENRSPVTYQFPWSLMIPWYLVSNIGQEGPRKAKTRLWLCKCSQNSSVDGISSSRDKASPWAGNVGLFFGFMLRIKMEIVNDKVTGLGEQETINCIRN